ncbi:hypothetical protein [Nesterenkonia suensis]
MTEMTSFNSTSPAPALAPTGQSPSSVVQIAEWAAELDAAHKLGTALATSRFLPDSLTIENKKPKPAEQVAADAAVIILAGKSLGLDPLASVQNIFTVRGRPAMYARTAVGISMSHGHEVERTNADQNSVTVRARRKGAREWHTFTWDMSRAKQAGYDSNPLYQRDPIAMLTAKAQMEACRNLFPDVLAGMPYSAEDIELEDLGEVQETPKTTVKRSTRSKSTSGTKSKSSGKSTKEEPPAEQETPEPAPTPAEESAEDPAPQDSPAGDEPIQQQTWDEIKSLLTEKDPTAKPGPWAMETIGRTVKRWQDFTQTEGDQMLQLLINGETQ